MGSNLSKGTKQCPDTPCCNIVKHKYGEEWVPYFHVWVDSMGFPKEGSFSLNQLKKLEQHLTKQEQKLRSKKTIKTTDLDLIDGHRASSNKWKEEAERRDKKKVAKVLPKSDESDVCDNCERCEKATKADITAVHHTQNPSPSAPPKSSLYPTLEEYMDLKKTPLIRYDDDLTPPRSRPIPPSSPPPAYQETPPISPQPDLPSPQQQHQQQQGGMPATSSTSGSALQQQHSDIGATGTGSW